MLRIGLTGGIGSGKSTVANYFAALGVPIIDSDVLAREVVNPGTSALKEIVAHFGTTILTKENHLDRAKLRKLIFNHAAEQKWLENLLHPLILQKMAEQIQALSAPYCILVIPLLLEKQIPADRILVVDTSNDLQIQRTSQRDKINIKQVRAILQTQLTRTERCAQADDIIHNEGDLAELKQQVRALHEKYLRLAVK